MLGHNWKSIIEEQLPIINADQKINDLLLWQLSHYLEKKLPSIPEAEIQNIPVKENYNILVDINTQKNPRITMLPTPNSPFESPECNSGLKNASKVRKGIYQKLALMVETLDTLAPQFGYEPGQISIKVFEGLRDLKTQQKLFENKEKEIARENAGWSNEQIYQEACRWVTPVRKGIHNPHSTGAAVDIRLWDEKKKDFVDVGPFGVIWGKNTTAPIFSEDLSKVQKQNRTYLILAANEAGLSVYHNEIWHLSADDKYDVYCREKDPTKRMASYAPVGPKHNEVSQLLAEAADFMGEQERPRLRVPRAK